MVKLATSVVVFSVISSSAAAAVGAALTTLLRASRNKEVRYFMVLTGASKIHSVEYALNGTVQFVVPKATLYNGATSLATQTRVFQVCGV
jgi:hypothetical protein